MSRRSGCAASFRDQIRPALRPHRIAPQARQRGRRINWRTGQSMTSQNTVDIPAGEIPTRDQIALEDTWDLSGIYDEESDWEADASRMPASIEAAASHRGALGEAAGP